MRQPSFHCRLLCAIEGKYLDQEVSQELREDDDFAEEDETEHASFSCSIPSITGRGYIEVLSVLVAEFQEYVFGFCASLIFYIRFSYSSVCYIMN